MDTISILRLSQCSRAINDLCQKTKMLEKRASQYVSSITPFVATFARIQDYALLLKKGFQTTYSVFWEPGILSVHSKDVTFGAPQTTVREFALEIHGLPPPKGTKVWAVVDTDGQDYRIPYAHVYWSKEEVIEAWDNEHSSFLNYLKDLMNEVGKTKESIFEDLFGGQIVEGIIIREVELP